MAIPLPTFIPVSSLMNLNWRDLKKKPTIILPGLYMDFLKKKKKSFKISCISLLLSFWSLYSNKHEKMHKTVL